MALKASLVITGDAASATAALGQLDAALDKNAAAAKRAGAANDEFGRKAEQGAQKAVKASGAAQAGAVNLGRQVQDVAVQLQSGTNIGTILAQQGGQVADAVAMMGGRFAGLAGFLAGPWGAGIIVGAGVLLNYLIPALMGTGDAAEESKKDVLDLSGSFTALANNANVAKKALDDLRASMPQGSQLSTAATTILKAQLAAMGTAARADRDLRGADALVSQLMRYGGRDTAIAAAMSRRDALARKKAEAERAARTAEVQLEEVNGAALAGRIQERNRQVLNARSKPEKNARSKPEKPSGRKPRSAGDPVEYGEDIAARIARITDQFADLPLVIARSNDAMRQLDDIASDIEKKKPPNYGAIKDSLVGAREVIEASLTKPFDEYLEKAQQAAAIDQLILSGKRDQAVALQDALQQQRVMGPLTEQQLATILKTVTAERERGELLQQQQELIGNYLDATRSVRGEIEAILSGTGKLSNLPQIFKNLQAKVLAEKIFGPMFRDLDKWVQDESGMKGATSAYIDSTKETTAAAYDLAAAFRNAGGQIRASASSGAGASAFDQAFGDLGDPVRAANGEEQTPIVVTAQLPRQPGSLLDVSVDEYMRKVTQGTAKSLTDALNGVAGTQFFSKFTGTLAGAMQGYLIGGGKFGAGLGLARGLFDEIGPGLLGNAGKGISKALDKGFRGMATGSQIAGLAGAFGIKLNNTGAQIGGAIGGALPIPGGAILGSLAGGLLGNLFGKRPRGAASVTGSGVTGGTNDAALTQSILGQGGDLQATIATIAERLGGRVGSYDVGLGRYKDYYQVSSKAGDPRLGNSHFGRDSKSALYDGTDAAAAAAAAIAEAIRDGAVEGVSTKVAKALASNRDVEKALAEAMKVQELEELLGGLTGAIDKAFAKFDGQAKERLRIATAYGFDIVKIEELNAKERLKLSKQLLENQVGSLQRLIDEMTGGSLFEGSAVDRRSSLLEQIGKAKAETDAGTEGAADKLAGLLEQLNSVSKDVYGTTGGFAADRGAILDQARDAIARANQRIADAQAKSDPALVQTNAALDENNDQNAKLIAIGTQTNELLADLSRGSTGGSSLSLLDMARTNSV